MNTSQLCSSVRDSLSPLFDCAVAPREGIRVRTPLMYPDGGMVDVFVLGRDNQYSITDFGEATGWLRMQSANLRRSQKQNRMLEDTCQTLGVEFHRGQLMLRASRTDSLEAAVLRVAQAVVRVCDT